MKLPVIIRAIVPCLMMFLLLLPIKTGCASAPGPVELYVSAGVGMMDAVTAVNKKYQQDHNNITIVENYAAAGTLQKQIEQGAPADVFISASEVHMDNLQKGLFLIDETRINLLANRVVLIVPTDNPAGIGSFTDLINAGVKKIAIGDPDFVPIGIYARQTFEELGIAEDVRPREILGADVRQVLTYVEGGYVDAGIVFATDAAISDKVKVVDSAPADINDKIVFPAAVIKASKNPDAARDYLDYLASDEAGAIFERYGFSMAAN